MSLQACLDGMEEEAPKLGTLDPRLYSNSHNPVLLATSESPIMTAIGFCFSFAGTLRSSITCIPDPGMLFQDGLTGSAWGALAG